MESSYDVVVVGAGMAGLATARALVRVGANVCLLEARDRVGGRTLSEPVGGAVLDLGGQWIGPGQPRLRALTDELGLTTFPTFHSGKKLIDLGDGVREYKGDLPAVSLFELVRLQLMIWRLRFAGRGVDVSAPWRAKIAPALDGESAARWAAERFGERDSKKLVDLLVRSVWSSEPHEVSMLYFVAYGKAAGSAERLARVSRGAQEGRFVEGAQTLSLRLAEELGERVRLSSPVSELAWSSQGATLTIEGGANRVRARKVVLALAPSLTARIRYTPALPPARTALAAGARMGRTIKCLVLYERAFWRERGLSGESLLHGGPCVFTYDNCSHDGRVAALVAFITGDEATRCAALSLAERKKAVIEQLGRFFGSDALSPTGYLEKNWTDDPWSGGCPAGIFGPGVFGEHGDALRTPVGCVHFAGTETATEWTGYLEGALQSAERVVAEVREA